jgi:hypothetical protein
MKGLTLADNLPLSLVRLEMVSTVDRAAAIVQCEACDINVFAHS